MALRIFIITCIPWILYIRFLFSVCTYVAQTPRGSELCVCCCVPSSLFLCLSETVAVSVCGRGESKFFHGSSQPSAHSAAKWVTVYPLPQLRVLMCETVYVEKLWICVRICVCVCVSANTAVRALCIFTLSFSVSLCHAHGFVNCHHCKKKKKREMFVGLWRTKVLNKIFTHNETYE